MLNTIQIAENISACLDKNYSQEIMSLEEKLVADARPYFSEVNTLYNIFEEDESHYRQTLRFICVEYLLTTINFDDFIEHYQKDYPLTDTEKSYLQALSNSTIQLHNLKHEQDTNQECIEDEFCLIDGLEKKSLVIPNDYDLDYLDCGDAYARIIFIEDTYYLSGWALPKLGHWSEFLAIERASPLDKEYENVLHLFLQIVSFEWCGKNETIGNSGVYHLEISYGMQKRSLLMKHFNKHYVMEPQEEKNSYNSYHFLCGDIYRLNWKFSLSKLVVFCNKRNLLDDIIVKHKSFLVNHVKSGEISGESFASMFDEFLNIMKHKNPGFIDQLLTFEKAA